MSEKGRVKTQQYRTKNGTYTAKLTPKQKAFADRRLNYKKESATESAMQTYNATDRATGSAIAKDNLAKAPILAYMDAHKDKAQERIVDLIDSKTERIALDASKDILDRTSGKATQRTEVTSTSQNVHLHFTNTPVIDD